MRTLPCLERSAKRYYMRAFPLRLRSRHTVRSNRSQLLVCWAGLLSWDYIWQLGQPFPYWSWGSCHPKNHWPEEGWIQHGPQERQQSWRHESAWECWLQQVKPLLYCPPRTRMSRFSEKRWWHWNTDRLLLLQMPKIMSDLLCSRRWLVPRSMSKDVPNLFV